MPTEPVIFVHPRMMTADVKAQAANAGASVNSSDRVPLGQVFVHDPDGQFTTRREVVEFYNAAFEADRKSIESDQRRLAEDHRKLWGPGQRLLNRVRKR